MKIEIRADGKARLTGYVNVVERESRPIYTPRGRVNEKIEAGVFNRAISKGENITLTKDHGSAVLAETRAGTLKLTEDSIGLKYDAEISDAETIEEARAGKIRGMSFGMRNVADALEDRAAPLLPLRKISGLDLDHITLVVNKTPCYAATSCEMRADNGEEITETRAMCAEIELTEERQLEKTDINSDYRQRLSALLDN